MPKKIDYTKLTAAEIGVLVSTWVWRIPKAGYKFDKDFCDEHSIPHPQFSLWINGKSEPMPHNIEKVEKALKAKGV